MLLLITEMDQFSCFFLIFDIRALIPIQLSKSLSCCLALACIFYFKNLGLGYVSRSPCTHQRQIKNEGEKITPQTFCSNTWPQHILQAFNFHL